MSRSPEEREAARREREARRASANDRPPAFDPTPPEVPLGATGDPRDDPPLAPRPAWDPHDDGDPTLEHDDAEYEIPLGVKRAGPAPAPAQRPAPVRRTRRRSWAARAFAIVAIVLVVGAIWFLVELFQPFHGSGHGRVSFTVRAGASAGTIGDELANDGIVSSGFFFGLRAMLAGDRGKLLAGTYRLKYDMTYAAVLSILTTPPPRAPTTNVTIIPGRTRLQIATLLRQQGVRGSYLAATRHTSQLDLRAYGAPRRLGTLEGFLFPSTYQLVDPIGIPALVKDQLTTFKQQFASVDMRYAQSKNLTPYDVLIIASMIQAESGTAHDNPLIASVIYNRLRLGMPLGIDATVRYAVNNYTTPLTDSQLNSPSPYNTRNHVGLPPTPIGNPDLASIQAAAHPARTGYLYFVAQVCGNGASVFATTYSQFLLDSQRYNEARAKRRGHSPTKC